MPNIKLTISYDGTDYLGWQKQKKGKTIQDTLESALSKIFKKPVKVTGSGRTDAGVHALAQVANFTVKPLRIPLAKLPSVINNALPPDIRITGCELVDEDFNARRSAKEKTYLYVISNSVVQSPFSARYAWHVPSPLDIKKMKRAARHLKGRHDFKAFSASDSSTENTIRTIKKITIEKNGTEIFVLITANGFLKQMARNIVGTLVDVGRGKIDPEEIKNILLSRDRKRAGKCAPANGLFLLNVRY